MFFSPHEQFAINIVLVSAISAIASKNPVYSVLFLTLSFGNVFALLFLLKLKFVPITFLVLYTVLFLFVLMMLNIKLTELKDENAHFLPVAYLLGVVFVLELFVMVRLGFPFVYSPFLDDLVNSNASFIDFPLFYLNESNMRSLGQILYVEY
jgi:NADH-quinone oxidoreductase subunit J